MSEGARAGHTGRTKGPEVKNSLPGNSIVTPSTRPLLDAAQQQMLHRIEGDRSQQQRIVDHRRYRATCADGATEHYLGSKQKIRDAVNDRIGIEPAE